MNSSPLISIVLPTYNGSRFLAEAVSSCRNQTFQDWELIIVDDCSTDDTPRLIAELAAGEPRIRHFRNPQNLKLPGTLNAGFSQARGQLLTWTSDDNRYLPQALERMKDVLDKRHDVQLVYADVHLIDDDGNFLRRHPRDQPDALAYSNPVAACFLYRRVLLDTLGGYDTSLFLVEDLDFWLRASQKFKLIHLSEDLYEFRWHATSLTATRQQEIVRLREQLLRRHLPKLRFASRSARAHGRMELAKYAWKRGNQGRGVLDILEATWLSPITAARDCVRLIRRSVASDGN